MVLLSTLVEVILTYISSWGGREKSLAEAAQAGVEEAKGKAGEVVDKVKETVKSVSK